MSSLPRTTLTTRSSTFTAATFIEHVKSAVLHSDDPVFAVRQTLEIDIAVNPGFLPERFLTPTPGTYARRPLYIDPKGRFSLLVMVWDRDQGTPLHDHDGLWVVECIYSGRMQVTNYAYEGESQGLHQFRETDKTVAVAGESDERVPPFEYHVMRNAFNQPAVTIHVYGGTMDKCGVYEPVEGGYAKSTRILKLT